MRMNSAHVFKGKATGWVRNNPDDRDFPLGAVLEHGLLGPAKVVNILPRIADIKDQGQLGSCVAHGTTSCMEFALKQINPVKDEHLSRLFAYYNGRKVRGWQNQDSGCMIRDCVDQSVKTGVCDEGDWPYITTKFAISPPAKAFADAKKCETLAYFSGKNLTEARTAMAQFGQPVIFGMDLWDEFFEPDENGIVPAPANVTESQGGHCMYIAGFDDDANSTSPHKYHYTVVNSWGKGWGVGGVCYVPFETMEQRAGDLTIIRKVEPDLVKALKRSN